MCSFHGFAWQQSWAVNTHMHVFYKFLLLSFCRVVKLHLISPRRAVELKLRGWLMYACVNLVVDLNLISPGLILHPRQHCSACFGLFLIAKFVYMCAPTCVILIVCICEFNSIFDYIAILHFLIDKVLSVCVFRSFYQPNAWLSCVMFWHGAAFKARSALARCGSGSTPRDASVSKEAWHPVCCISVPELSAKWTKR